MFRRTGVAVVSTVALLVAAGSAAAPAAAYLGGCAFDATLEFNGTGLTMEPSRVSYSLSGTLSNCARVVDGTPATAVVSAGRTLIVDGLTLVEPEAGNAYNASCRGDGHSGVLFVEWPDGKLTIIDWGLQGPLSGGAMHGITRHRITLPVLDPQPGDPSEMTVTTTRYGFYHDNPLFYPYYLTGGWASTTSITECSTGVKQQHVRGAFYIEPGYGK